MSARKPTDNAPPAGDPADLPWTRLLFGDDSWPMLLVMLACGYLLYLLAPGALPAILVVVLIGLAVKVWRIRRNDGTAKRDERQ